MTRVKICGITNIPDARVVVDAGADAYGLVFAKSPRQVSPETAREIVREMSAAPCVPVGVFVDELPARVAKIARSVGLRCVQLHGNETPETVGELLAQGFDVVKAFRIARREDLAALDASPATAFLLDAFVPGQAGGTGRTFDWSIADEARHAGRIIVSGGLGVDNVLDAIRTARPFGVDASSRLEKSPGLKDPDLVREFVRLVKSAESVILPSASPWPR